MEQKRNHNGNQKYFELNNSEFLTYKTGEMHSNLYTQRTKLCPKCIYWGKKSPLKIHELNFNLKKKQKEEQIKPEKN